MKIIRLLTVAFTAAFFIAPALAQNPGTVTNHAFAIGKGPGVQGLSSVACATAGMLPVGQTSADPICRSVTGDVTINSSGVTAIGTAKVTYAMMQNVAALSVVGRSANSSGVPADISCAAASDAVLRESGSVLGCGTIATNGIANNAVTNAKLATMANATFKCRNTAGTGNPEDCTATQSTALLNAMVGDSGSGGTKGLVPAPGAGDAGAGKYLKADGTYAVPPGGSGLPATTKAAQQTGTDNTSAVTPLHQQDHDSAVKAHASISATCTTGTCTLGESYNVTSITRSGTGAYTVNFTTAFASASGYACTVTSNIFGHVFNTRTTGGVGVSTAALSAGAFVATDSQFDIACYGRQ